MKRLSLFLLPVLLFFVVSCHNQSYGILSYQDKNIEAECTLNGEYKILVTKSGEKSSVSFIEPSSLSSVSFTYEGERVTARASDMEITLPKNELEGAVAVLSMFSLSEECLVSVSKGENGDIMEFDSEHGSYRLTMGENDMPKRIEIEAEGYQFDIIVESIMIK
ncbi:MAG: hypothetical protein J6A96_01570 [Clostridia bacterium]|nr:hypothetical protein [Clostridia bacterium]